MEALVERLPARVRELESVVVQQRRVLAREPVGPQPGKQPGSASVSWNVVDKPNERFEVAWIGVHDVRSRWTTR